MKVKLDQDEVGIVINSLVWYLQFMANLSRNWKCEKALMYAFRNKKRLIDDYNDKG